MDRRQYLQAVGGGGILSLTGCTSGATSDERAEAPIVDAELTVATSTTTHDSGLLDVLVPGFEETFGASVSTVVRGTGGALRTGRNGDCDAVLVHARSLEDQFLRDGHGVNRRTVMVNDFLIVGPPDDPANIAGQDPVAALRAIASAEATFLSRGDQSGTHVRERELWTAADIDPAGSWYSETGQGMGQTLVMASEADAYTLTDRGTFLAVSQNREGLIAHVDRGIADPPALLRNEYAIIPVNPARHDVSYPLALSLVGYVTGPGQERIGEFRVGDEQVFRPVGMHEDPNFQQYVPRDWHS